MPLPPSCLADACSLRYGADRGRAGLNADGSCSERSIPWMRNGER